MNGRHPENDHRTNHGHHPVETPFNRCPGSRPARPWLVAVCLALLGGNGLSDDLAGSGDEDAGLAVTLSPDGVSLALSHESRLWVMPLAGGTARPLTPAGSVSRNPSFSPNGGVLVYQRRQAGQWDLWLLDLAAGDARRLTESDYDEVQPVFWPDGHSVVFASDRAGTFDVWELHLSSGALRRLTGRSGRASHPSVSEHGDVVYANEVDGRWSLYLLRAGVTTLLASRSHPLRAPSWRPGGGLVVLSEQPSPARSNLVMLLLDTRPLFKGLTSAEDVTPTPAAWISSDEFVYAAGGVLWKRPLGSAPREAVRFVPVAP